MRYFASAFMFCMILSCQGQPSTIRQQLDRPVGGGCEDCDIMYIGMPSRLSQVDTSAGWYEKGEKLVIQGRVFKRDGRTPAPGIVLYYWQTDSKGLYSPSPSLPKGAARHGHIRGWVMTDKDGRYSIFTARPTPYPGERIPAHIHLLVKEPGLLEYYVDDLVFDDDPLLTGSERKKMQYRGGSGILRLEEQKGIQIGEHDVILGLHIPGHPDENSPTTNTGLSIGDDQPSFIPFHAWGPDKGSRACPVCKYGRYQGVIYVVGNEPDMQEVRKWLLFLEEESRKRKQYLKAYFVYAADKDFDKSKRQKELEEIGNSLDLRYTALTYVPSMTDEESEMNLNMLDNSIRNAFIIYRRRIIVDKFLDLAATDENFEKIRKSLGQTAGNLIPGF